MKSPRTHQQLRSKIQREIVNYLKNISPAVYLSLALLFGIVGYLIGSSYSVSSCSFGYNHHVDSKSTFVFTSVPEGMTAKLAHPVLHCKNNCLEVCDIRLSQAIPSHRSRNVFPKVWGQWLERNFPPEKDRLNCLVPPPEGYKLPIRWPNSRDYIWLANVPNPQKLAKVKAEQHWLEVKGDQIYFPGGGTHFKGGADKYVGRLGTMIPIGTGAIRTVFDVGCGVGSFGAALLKVGVLAMSVAPRDVHENQMQMVLERGLPGMLGFLNRFRLPYPSRSFDMAHCSRCRIEWHLHEDKLLLEIDRLLRPGGYFVWSAPPVYREDSESRDLWVKTTAVMKRLCWKEFGLLSETAVFQKPRDNECWLNRNPDILPPLCENGTDPDAVWQVPLERCIQPIPKPQGALLPIFPERANWAARLGKVNPKEILRKDSKNWARRAAHLEQILDFSGGKIRNIMDARAGLGGLAVGLMHLEVWVMNVMPHLDPNQNSLKTVYDRGFIGTVHNWCEDFSSYPRTYDLVHAADLFSLDHDCTMDTILLEFDRLLRPEGFAVIRDSPKAISQAKEIAVKLRWDVKSKIDVVQPDKSILVCRKQFSVPAE